MFMNFSVLISLYIKEHPEYLRQSLDSVFCQTRKADEVILVEDGPLTSNLEDVVTEYQQKFHYLKVVKLPKNGGLGKALNEGLKHCSYDIVARMDTDDVAKPDRFEKQISMFEAHPDLDVCGAWMDEFIDLPINPVSIKKIPETHEELFLYGMRRNPVNHPVCMFKKKSVMLNGDYQDYPLFEDYFLWARMMRNGCRFYCIQESLLYFRRSPFMIRRRSGWKYALTEVRFQFMLYGIRYISFGKMVKNICIRFPVRIMPNKWRTWIYGIIRMM